MVHKISGIPKMGKNLVYTVCTCKISTTLKAYMLVIFSQNLIKLGQVGPYDLRDSKNGQKLVYTVCTCKMSTALKAYMSVIFGQNLIKLGQGGYVGHFWSEFDKTWTRWSIRSQGFHKLANIWCILYEPAKWWN